MLINFSNHPSEYWSKEQLEAAKTYGTVVDEPFPAVPPEADEETIGKMADECVSRLQGIIAEKNGDELSPVHIMGEMTLTFAIVDRLLKMGIKCLASTTRREVTFDADGNKVATFRFVKFREYMLL